MKKYLLTALLSASMMGSASAVTLVYGGNGEPVSLEPGNITDGISITVQRQIYDTLVDFKDGTTDAAPGLALSWRSNAAATVWTFNLRRGVKFQDGTPFNADAVVFNWNRFWDAKDATGFRDQGRTFEIMGELLGGFKGDKTAVIKNIVKVNDYTVRFELTGGNTDFPVVIGSGYFGIASPTAIKAQGARYGTPASTPVGTGPFSFVSWKTGDAVTLKANTGYWGGRPLVDTVVIRSIRDASQRLNELKAGTIDFTSDLAPDSLAAVRADRNLTAVLKPSFNVGFVSMNNKNPILAKQAVRTALGMAINKKAIADAFWNGLAVSNASFLPPVMAWANSSAVPANHKYDPAAAKRMIADAGYPNGFSVDLWYMPVSRPYFPTPKPIAEAIAADLAGIGVKVNLRTEDWAKYLVDRNKEPGFDMYMIGWTGDYGSPDNFYGAYYGANASDDINYNPPALQSLLEQGRAALTRDAKAKVYAQLHKLTYDAGYRLPMVHSQPLAATRSYVKGWIPSPLGSESWAKISVPGKR